MLIIFTVQHHLSATEELLRQNAEKGSAYYITSVNIAGKESEKSRIVQAE
ncbi:MAG: hypothetical protein ACQEUT_14790 [Bacillota bacterium]